MRLLFWRFITSGWLPWLIEAFFVKNSYSEVRQSWPANAWLSSTGMFLEDACGQELADTQRLWGRTYLSKRKEKIGDFGRFIYAEPLFCTIEVLQLSLLLTLC